MGVTWHKSWQTSPPWGEILAVALVIAGAFLVVACMSVARFCSAMERSSSSIALGISNAARAERTVRHVIVFETKAKEVVGE